MFYWSFTSLVHVYPPQFLIVATPIADFGEISRDDRSWALVGTEVWNG